MKKLKNKFFFLLLLSILISLLAQLGLSYGTQYGTNNKVFVFASILIAPAYYAYVYFNYYLLGLGEFGIIENMKLDSILFIFLTILLYFIFFTVIWIIFRKTRKSWMGKRHPPK